MKLAREAGVMVACKGTIQGQSGYYMDYDGKVYYFGVDKYETWWQIVKPNDFEKNKRQFELDNTPVLVADPLTKAGHPGFYREYHRPEGTDDEIRKHVKKSSASNVSWWEYDKEGDRTWYPTDKKKKKKKKQPGLMSLLFSSAKEEKRPETTKSEKKERSYE